MFGTADDVLGSQNDIPLLNGFLNPPAYFDGGTEGTLTPQQAAGSIIMGMSDQTGNELDEFVTETLRNNLLGLPLDLATVNMARARSEGVPPLNVFRRDVFNATHDTAMTPYTSWVDFGEHLKHPESLVNFVAAYGQHPSITSATTVAAKREAARLIVHPVATDDPTLIPGDAADFMNSVGAWANDGAQSRTGLDQVDLWVGGLAEVTNVFGGLLGSTFNYVFENQLTDLQNGDRLYYLARTPGMNLRTQLEGNSFAELIMRNTNAHSLKADAFATADCKFELKNLAGTPAGYAQFGNTVANDPSSECDETALLLRKPDGTIQYRARNTVDPSGINGQSVYNGTAGVDRIAGGNDSDTFWGGDSRDWIEGGDGADVALGGDGDDIITDLNGDDVPKGGPGDDAIDAGPGLDIVMGGEGKDFTNGGANANETFGGDGDDFIMLGESLDAAFGDSGDDYEEGGNQPDLMQGDSGNLFFLDDSQKPGSDILIGQGGDDDYDMEGGDDIGLGGPGIEKVAGASGYDWEIGIGDPQAQDLDLAIPLVPLDILTVGVRDKFNEVESLSGGDLNDILRGDDEVPSTVGGGGFIGCDVLDQRGLDRIAGLDALVPELDTPFQSVIGVSAAGDCPFLTDGLDAADIAAARVWGGGNILLGGAGKRPDRGSRRRRHHRRRQVPQRPAERAQRRRCRDRLRHGEQDRAEPDDQPVPARRKRCPDRPHAAGGRVRRQRRPRQHRRRPGDPARGGRDRHGAVLRRRANYTITDEGAGTTTVADNVDGTDGIDTVRGVELLKFTDQTVNLAPTAPGAPLIRTATAGNATATVNWDAPATDGGSPVNEYRVQVFTGGTLVNTVPGIDATARSRLVTGLTNGTSYTFRVLAVNAAGASAPSDASNAVTPTAPATVPGAPTIGTATAGIGSATVRWAAPANNGGSPITSYQVDVRSGGAVVRTETGIASGATSAQITGLTELTTYNFVVRAVNAIGASANSAVSNTVTIADATAPTITSRTPADGATGVARNVNVVVTFSERVVGVNATTLTLRRTSNNALVQAAVTLSADGRTATLNPTGNLAPRTQFTVTITGGAAAVRDSAGIPLASSTWRLTTN